MMIDANGRPLLSRRTVTRAFTASAMLLAFAGCVGRSVSPAIPLYDTHAHFFTPDTARYPQDLRGAREGEDSLRARIIASPNTPETVLPVWKANGVVGGVAVQYSEVYKRDNRFVLDSGDRHPDKIAIVVILDPQSADSPAELRRLARAHRIAGVRITGRPAEDGSYPWLEASGTQNLWRAADELRLSVVIMALPAEVSQRALTTIVANATRFPNAPVVLDHVGWAQSSEDLGALQGAIGGQKNVFLKFTTVNLERIEHAGGDTASYVRRLVDLFGADRVLWGSDFGRSPVTFGTMVERLNAATSRLTANEKRKLMHDTGYRIFHRR